ncbi:hypothetical protein [Nonomuraea candida]|uniref:hypothetical protein n=1 Tax=Nonomuraea candida TaxID=359159 RepID=UPI0005B7BB10|nr:hypothetical protein [Nonomuraea candida]
MKAEIDWDIPATPPGWKGALQRFMGPGKTRAEQQAELTGSLACTALLGWHLIAAPIHGSWPQWALAALIGLDLVGGVMTNATNAAKRWYHHKPPRARLGFVAAHTAYLAAMAFVVMDTAWSWFLANTTLLLAGALLIEKARLEAKRPAAMAAYMTAILVNQTALPVPDTLDWFTTLFFLKLLVCHLVPEAPLRSPGRPGEHTR